MEFVMLGARVDEVFERPDQRTEIQPGWNVSKLSLHPSRDNELCFKRLALPLPERRDVPTIIRLRSDRQRAVVQAARPSLEVVKKLLQNFLVLVSQDAGPRSITDDSLNLFNRSRHFRLDVKA